METTSLTQDKIDQLKSQYGPDLMRVDNGRGSGPLVFRPPTKLEWRRFADGVAADRRGESRDAKMHELAITCCVFPGPEHLSSVLERWPALATAIAGEIAELAGAGSSVQTGNL